MDGRFGDIRFQQLLAEPVATITGAFEQLGIDRDPSRGIDIERYLAEKPQGKFGVHRYTAEEWGFDPDVLHDELRPYTDFFGWSSRADTVRQPLTRTSASSATT